MDAIEQLKEDVHAGRVDAELLVNFMAAMQRQVHALQQQLHVAKQQLQAANQRIEELQKQCGDAGRSKVEEPYSLRAEEKRQEARKKTKQRKPKPVRRGRLTSAAKIALAVRHEEVFPEGVAQQDCQASHVRPVWRLEQGRAVVIAYHIYRGPNRQYGKIPGVLGRSEFGIEIVLEIAFLVYVIGLSFDKVCALLQFFQGLHLRKSQVDALLYRLARHWQNEFETLCTLLAHSAVVHADETGWSLQSVWAFVSEQARVLLFGVPKDAQTLQALLDPATFAGIIISDDAAVYANFSAAQKCWAHLLRKAIKLTLQAPNDLDYRAFADRLLEIYRSACRVQRDGRLSAAGRARRVAALDDEVLDLCAPVWVAELPKLADETEDNYRLLVEEVMRLMLAKELFTFVTAPPTTQPNGTRQPVAGTNNEAERTLRGPAQARDTGRTNKTLAGARRQTIVVSVLESLRLYLPCFTLGSVVAEVERWLKTGRSCYQQLLAKLKLSVAERPILDRVFPQPDSS
jgi:transposase